MKKQTHSLAAPQDSFTFSQSLRAIAATTLLATGASVCASTDYGPAFWRPAYSGHWNTTGYGKKFYVIHDIEGYYWGCIYYFQQSATRASVHYTINGKKDNSSDANPGEVSQMVRDAHYAWHAKCWNLHSMGTEHEGFASNPAWYTPEMCAASSSLTRAKADQYGFPKTRHYIVAHGEEVYTPTWPGWASATFGIDGYCQTHTDPGPYWDWTGFMNLINSGGTPPPPPPPSIDWNAVASVKHNDGRLELFAVGQDTAIYQNWQPTPNAGFVGWFSLGGGFLCEVAAGKNADGRPQVFALGLNGNVYSKWWQTSDAWTDWVNLGGNMKRIVVGQNNADGRMEAFAIGADSQSYHNWQTAPNGSAAWTAWHPMGGNLK